MKLFLKQVAHSAMVLLTALSASTAALAASSDNAAPARHLDLLLVILATAYLCLLAALLFYIRKLAARIAVLEQPAQPKTPEPAPQPAPTTEPAVEAHIGEIADFMDEALAHEEFQIYLQPQVDQFTKSIIGAEALVRWVRPGVGTISPASFMPTFEKSGFIKELDQYVFRQVCAYQQARETSGKRQIPISVNLAYADLLDDSTCDALNRIAQEYDVLPSLIPLEISASIFLHDPVLVTSAIKRLQELGFRVSIDDIGKDGAIPASLSDLPSDALKLDLRSLQKAPTTQEQAALSAMLRSGHMDDNKDIMIESVETAEQADFFRYIGFRNVQGFLFYKPMPLNEFEQLMERGTSR